MCEPTQDFLNITSATDRQNVRCHSTPLHPHSQNEDATICPGKLEWLFRMTLTEIREQRLTRDSQDDLLHILWHFRMIRTTPYSCLRAPFLGPLYIGST